MIEPDPSCVFCTIVAGEAPAERVFEDDLTLAFMDVAPASRGHTLVIPKAHVPDVFALEQPHADAVWHSTVRVARGVRDALAPDGMSLHQSNGRIANQHVFHFHMHVIPRYAGSDARSGTVLAETAEGIRAALSAP